MPSDPDGLPGLVIRRFTMDDYDAVLELWRDAGLHHLPLGRDSREEMERQAGLPMTIFLLAEMDGRLVGSVICTHDGRKGWMNRLAVRPGSRRAGIATRLVQTGEEALRKEGMLIIACLIDDWNAASFEFFEKMGYVRQDGIKYLSKRDERDLMGSGC